jgi:hypothetical protein
MNEGVVEGENKAREWWEVRINEVVMNEGVVGGEDELSTSLRYAILCTLSCFVEREN